MPKCPPTGGVRLQEVSVSGGSTVLMTTQGLHNPLAPRRNQHLNSPYNFIHCHVLYTVMITPGSQKVNE